MKKFSKMFALILALTVVSQSAMASAVGASGGKKNVERMRDGSGNPVLFNDDKPWKVFEVKDTSTAAQLVDESSVAPKQGMIKRICLESAPVIPAAGDNVLIFDTATVADTSVTGAGRRIAPPIQRLSGVEKCVELNALFTAGVGVKNGTAVGGTYVYWRELGGSR